MMDINNLRALINARHITLMGILEAQTPLGLIEALKTTSALDTMIQTALTEFLDEEKGSDAEDDKSDAGWQWIYTTPNTGIKSVWYNRHQWLLKVESESGAVAVFEDVDYPFVEEFSDATNALEFFNKRVRDKLTSVW